jgi:hypothetical protein
MAPPPDLSPGVFVMTVDEFERSCSGSAPPAGLSPALLALWHDGHGDWDAAHTTAQDVDGEVGAWVHAYLHRKEGDLANAGYWYRRANRVAAQGSLEAEWKSIVAALMERATRRT